ELFMNNGYERTSLADIADRIGFTKPAIYYHFDNKQTLFEESCRLFMDLIEKSWPSQVEQLTSFKDALHGALGSIGKMVLGFQALMKVEDTISMFKAYLFIYEAITKIDWFRDSIKSFYAANISQLSSLMADGQEKGQIRKDLDPEVVSTAITALIEGMVLMNMADPDIDLEPLGEEMADSMWAMVRA
ncbi:MAG: TetR family transcriptional regulator, partial [Anaerolineales bacterium]|nr:TetR family transcriptional regulator [Anaerolineales bacterium]